MQRINDKGVCDKESIWNPKNCECECDKSCDVGENFKKFMKILSEGRN